MKFRVLQDVLISLRPRQWIKNLVIFAGLIFSRNALNPSLQIKVWIAFVTFCGVVSAGYLFNDVLDKERDKLHPVKKNRPIASSKLEPTVALVAAAVLVIASFAVSPIASYDLPLFLLAYLGLQVVYTTKLKHLVILDIFSIAGGFVIRAAAGAVVIGVYISPWLIVCTLLLALFLGLAKRRAELVYLESGASYHRPNLASYTIGFVDQMTGVTASATIVSYSLYSFTAFESKEMMLTIPFVLYGIFRYLFLIHSKARGGSPEQVLLTDKPLLLNTIIWVVSAVLILRYM